MEQLKTLTTTVTDIDTLAVRIIRRSVKIMNELHDVDSSLVDELLDELAIAKGPETSREEALKRLQEFSLTFTADAERVRKELPKFVTEAEDSSYTINTKDCPFLALCWNGDMYDQVGIAGLKALLADLKEQLQMISSKHLIDNVVDVIKKGSK